MKTRGIKIIITVIVGCVFAGWAIPNFIRARATKASNPCIINLRLLEAGKEQWAIEHNKTNGADVTWKDVLPYIGRGPADQIPKCPDGGVYILGKVGEQPKCSIGGMGHVLPTPR
jgi:hypothetical protein